MPKPAQEPSNHEIPNTQMLGKPVRNERKEKYLWDLGFRNGRKEKYLWDLEVASEISEKSTVNQMKIHRSPGHAKLKTLSQKHCSMQ